MTVQGSPMGGLTTVGQIVPTNEVTFRENLNGMQVAVELLSNHTPGGAVVDQGNHFVGFVSEFDVLRALEDEKDLTQ